MSKNQFDFATELTIEVIKARSSIIASCEGGSFKKTLANEWLNDDKIVETYIKIRDSIYED